MWCCAAVISAIALSAILHCFTCKYITCPKLLLYIDEFIGQACAAVFLMEIGLTTQQYGIRSLQLGASVSIYYLLRYFYFTRFKLYDSPVTFLTLYYERERKITATILDIVTVVGTQLLALSTGQQFARFVWQHADKIHVNALQTECRSALSASNTWQFAAYLEGLALFTLAIISMFSSEKVRPVLMAAASTAWVVAFSHVSGQFMNGSIATAFTYGCKGQLLPWQFFIIYWVAPLVGTAVAWESVLGIKKLGLCKSKSA